MRNRLVPTEIELSAASCLAAFGRAMQSGQFRLVDGRIAVRIRSRATKRNTDVIDRAIGERIRDELHKRYWKGVEVRFAWITARDRDLIIHLTPASNSSMVP